MNQIHRLGLTIAGVVTGLLVGGAFVVQGYVGAQSAIVGPTVSPAPTDSPTSTPTIEPQTIYINPVPTPATVTIVKRAAPPPVQVTPQPTPAPTPSPIHVVVPGPTGDDRGGDD